jgi:carboxyl-terminal processing protease
MKTTKILLLVGLCVLFCLQFGALAKEDPKDQDIEKVPFYLQYLEDPSKLGFNPDEKTFQRVYSSLKNQFIDKFDDEEVYAGVIKEVGILLSEAKIDAAKLKDLPKNKDCVSQIMSAYQKQINPGLLMYVCIRGMLASLNDPYTNLLTPKEYRILMEQMQERSFGGIGIVIELDKKNNNQLTVMEPLEETPAMRVGLQAGDMIVRINGKSTQGISLEVAQSNIRGPIGTKVILTIRRKGVFESKDFSITRDSIKLISVTPKMLENKVGYIRMRLFGENTSMEMRKAMDSLKDDGAKAIILDLRNNGGGYVSTAVDVSSLFLPQGKMVVNIINRAGQETPYATTGNSASSLPLVVLVNKYSASASEIVAGCLQDYGEAKIIGDKTFGKGSVQQVFPNADQSALKITIARYFTPKGRNFDNHGIEPDIEVPMETGLIGKSGDIQLKAAQKEVEKELNAKNKSGVN